MSIIIEIIRLMILFVATFFISLLIPLGLMELCKNYMSKEKAEITAIVVWFALGIIFMIFDS